MRTQRQLLGDAGEVHVAECLRSAGFGVDLIGGNFPGYDILAHHVAFGRDIRIQVKTWKESRYERRLAQVRSVQKADAYVLVRADCPDSLLSYVYLADEIAVAPVIREARSDYPFTRDPGAKNPAQVGFWVRHGWSFCDPKRLNAWHLLRKCEIEGVATVQSLPKFEGLSERRPVLLNLAPVREARNGIRAPKPGGLCDQAWLACGVLAADLERLPRRAEAVAYAISLGLSAGNMRTEYGYWRRFSGLTP